MSPENGSHLENKATGTVNTVDTVDNVNNIPFSHSPSIDIRLSICKFAWLIDVFSRRCWLIDGRVM